MVIPRFRVTHVSIGLIIELLLNCSFLITFYNYYVRVLYDVLLYIAVCFAMCVSAYRLVNYVERTFYSLQLNEEYIFEICMFSYYGQYREMSARKLCFAEVCNERPCAPGSICTRSIDAPYYHCSCRIGRTGQNCDIGANSFTNTSSTLLLPIITDVMSMLLRRYVDVVPTLCIIVFVFSNRWRC